MSIDLTKDPGELFLTKMVELNPTLPDLETSAIDIIDVYANTPDRWSFAAESNAATTSGIKGSPKLIAPTYPWYVPEGIFVVRKTITIPEGNTVFRICGSDTLDVYINGNLRHSGEFTVDTYESVTLTGVSGVCDIAVVCKNSSGYGSVCLSIYTGGVKVAITDNSWKCKIAGTSVKYAWDHILNQKYLDWDASVRYPNHPWERDDITGTFIYNGRSSTYTIFGIRRMVTSPTASVTLKYVTDNGGKYSINGEEYKTLVHGRTTAITVVPNEPFNLCIKVYNIGGPTGLQLDVIDADGNILAATDTSWGYHIVGTYDKTLGAGEGDTYNEESMYYVGGEIEPKKYVKKITPLSVAKLGLLTLPSEVAGDVVNFTYDRIPLHLLFNQIDAVLDSKHIDNWGTAIETVNNTTEDRALTPSAYNIALESPWATLGDMFLVKKTMSFLDAVIIIKIQCVGIATVFVDGAIIGTTGGEDMLYEFTYTSLPGAHVIGVVLENTGTDGHVGFVVYDNEKVRGGSNNTWKALEVSYADDLCDLAGVYVPDVIELEYDVSEVGMFSDNTNVTLRDHLLRRYGVNLGLNGYTITSLGSNIYEVEISNMLYVGTLNLRPFS